MSLLQSLTLEDIIKIINSLGVDVKQEHGVYTMPTICHGGDSMNKLVLYPNTLLLRCYTHCGTMNIAGLVQKVRDCSFIEAVGYIKSVCDIGINIVEGFVSTKEDDIAHLIHRPKRENVNVNIYSKSILRHFPQILHETWINEGMTIDSLLKYNIRFDIGLNRIIIPHYYHNGDLVCIRARNLEQSEIDAGKKYIPITYKKTTYSSPNSAYLYGLNISRHNIETTKTVIIFEGEKSCISFDSYFDTNISVGVCGSNLSHQHIEILNNIGVETVYVAVDKEFEHLGSMDEQLYLKKIESSWISKLTPYFEVKLLWDHTGLLDYKDSPIDKGKDTLLKLMSTAKQY